MSTELPKLPHDGGIRTFHMEQFAGYNHTLGAKNGELWDVENLTGDSYPLMASRAPRHLASALLKPNGLYCTDKLFTVDGTTLYVDGVAAGTVTDTEKIFAGISGRVVIFPDKKIYTAEGELEDLESEVSASGLVFGNGTYAGESAELNTITHPTSGFDWSEYFKVGDAVAITGTTDGENDRTPIIREIDGNKLRFYENTFAAARTYSGTVTLKRAVPDLDFICENENRLWGAKGDSLFCSKLGDPYNWNVFDGLSTDSWSVESGTPGDFTACTSFLGYPVFFKEDRVFKVYGTKPSNFQVMGSATLGVLAGCHKTLAVAGETLFYLSRVGMVAYTGGVPQSVADAFGEVRYNGGAAGSDGTKLYVSLTDTEGGHTLFCYHTKMGQWYKEDDTNALFMGYLNGVYALTASGSLMLLGTPLVVPQGATEESAFASWAEFADFTMDSFDGKYPVRLRLRAEIDTGTTLSVLVRYDSGAGWEAAGTVTAGLKRSVYLPCPIRRCDHFRLKLAATGGFKVYSMEWELYDGTYQRKRG